MTQETGPVTPPNSADTQFAICPTMNIISTVGHKKLCNYRVNWEKIYEIDTNDLYDIVYKKDGKFFILVDSHLNINIYETNKGLPITQIVNKKPLELISWTECDNGEIVDTDSMFEYVEKSLPIVSSVSNSILEDKTKFDFIIYGGEGQLNLSIFGIFNIENLIKLQGQFLAHVSDEDDIINNYIVAQHDSDLMVYHLSIDFLKKYPHLNKLSLICSKISKYFSALQESIKALLEESHAYIEYTAKIVDLLKDETENYADDLYELLLTGMMSKGVHTWLTDYLLEVGLKRWQSILLKCFQLCRKLIFTSILPLIERLILNYSHFSSMMINKSKDQIVGKLQNLLKYFYKFMTDLNTEFKNFNKFIGWLNLVFKSLNEDLNEDKMLVVLKNLSEVNIDTVSDFLDNHLNRSCIAQYTDKKHPINSLVRDLQVFINARFSILKMEIKKQSRLATTYKIASTDISLFKNCFQKSNNLFYVCSLVGNLLNINIVNLQTSETQLRTIEFDKTIYDLKPNQHRSDMIYLLFEDNLVELDLSACTTKSDHDDGYQNLHKMSHGKFDKSFKLTAVLLNDNILVYLDHSKFLVVQP